MQYPGPSGSFRSTRCCSEPCCQTTNGWIRHHSSRSKHENPSGNQSGTAGARAIKRFFQVEIRLSNNDNLQWVVHSCHTCNQIWSEIRILEWNPDSMIHMQCNNDYTTAATQPASDLRKTGFQGLCKLVQIFHVPGIEKHTGQTPLSEEFKTKVLGTKKHNDLHLDGSSPHRSLRMEQS